MLHVLSHLHVVCKIHTASLSGIICRYKIKFVFPIASLSKTRNVSQQVLNACWGVVMYMGITVMFTPKQCTYVMTVFLVY